MCMPVCNLIYPAHKCCTFLNIVVVQLQYSLLSLMSVLFCRKKREADSFSVTQPSTGISTWNTHLFHCSVCSIIVYRKTSHTSRVSNTSRGCEAFVQIEAGASIRSFTVITFSKIHTKQKSTEIAKILAC